MGDKIDDSCKLYRLAVVYRIKEGTLRVWRLALPFGDARGVIAYPSIVGVAVESVAIDSCDTVKRSMDTRHNLPVPLCCDSGMPFRLYPEGGTA